MDAEIETQRVGLRARQIRTCIFVACHPRPPPVPRDRAGLGVDRAGLRVDRAGPRGGHGVSRLDM